MIIDLANTKRLIEQEQARRAYRAKRTQRIATLSRTHPHLFRASDWALNQHLASQEARDEMHEGMA